MDDESASRRSLLGVAGLASLCCVGPGTAAVTGGVAAGSAGAGLVPLVTTGVALFAAAFVLRRQTGCSGCGA